MEMTPDRSLLADVAERYVPDGAEPWAMGPLVGRWCGNPGLWVDTVRIPSPFPILRRAPWREAPSWDAER
jgi:hypothetical protein